MDSSIIEIASDLSKLNADDLKYIISLIEACESRLLHQTAPLPEVR